MPPLPCCTTFLHLPSFNVLIKWLIREAIHEKDGYLDEAQKLVAALSPQISILRERERQKKADFCTLKLPPLQFKRAIFTENKFKGEFLMYMMVSCG